MVYGWSLASFVNLLVTTVKTQKLLPILSILAFVIQHYTTYWIGKYWLDTPGAGIARQCFAVWLQHTLPLFAEEYFPSKGDRTLIRDAAFGLS